MKKIKGFRFAGIACGVKKNGRKDLGIVVFDRPCAACGVYTKNKVHAPSVALTRERTKKHLMEALIVVSGNASVCVREAGADAIAVTGELSKQLGIWDKAIAHGTTGVIGVRMPVARVIAGIPSAIQELGTDSTPFAEAIMTTDAFMKRTSTRFTLGGKTVNILGMGKGAGMIMPDMATMLMFIFTDANIGKAALAKAFKQAVDNSFNCISVDGDTSTNDMVLCFASGMAENPVIKESGPEFALFVAELHGVCLDLAKMVVRDGEGATKLIEIEVAGAKTDAEAKRVARTIANSQLVKTAFFGEDPNWGRIMGALGRSGVALDVAKVDVDVQGMAVVRNGFEADGFSEKKLARLLSKKEVSVNIDLKLGKGSTRFYTSDLTFEYVKVNSAYRT